MTGAMWQCGSVAQIRIAHNSDKFTDRAASHTTRTKKRARDVLVTYIGINVPTNGNHRKYTLIPIFVTSRWPICIGNL